MYECSEHGNFLRIRTPFWYPDGGIVDIFLKQNGDTFSLTDLGESTGWLRLQTLSGKRSPKQLRLIQDVCQTLGVEFFKGQLLMRCQDSNKLPAAIHKLGQAIVRISDIWFTTRTRTIESASDEVADFLQEQTISFDRGVNLVGRSGREWTVDFQTRTPTRSTLVYVLATGSRAAAHRISEHVVAGWLDLQALKVGPQAMHFVSLFDDTNDVWEEEEFKLVETLSDVCRWSVPDEFGKFLKAA
jgi:dihydroneopterin aldolase